MVFKSMNINILQENVVNILLYVILLIIKTNFLISLYCFYHSVFHYYKLLFKINID